METSMVGDINVAAKLGVKSRILTFFVTNGLYVSFCLIPRYELQSTSLITTADITTIRE